MAFGVLALFLSAGPVSLSAQADTETKILLMADALRARDSGDLPAARDSLQQLAAMAPGDATVRRLLESINTQLAAGAASAYAAPVASEPVMEDIPEIRFTREAVRPETSPPPAPATDPYFRRAAAEPEPAPAPEAAPRRSRAREAEPAASDFDDEAEALARAETQRLESLVESAQADLREARDLAKRDNYAAALALIAATTGALPANPFTDDVRADLAKQKGEVILGQAHCQLKQGDVEGAKTTLDLYAQEGLSSRSADRVANRVARAELDPPLPRFAEVSRDFLNAQRELAKLSAQGRAQYLGGDSDGAQETFRMVESLDPDAPEAKNFLRRIANEKAALGALNREKTRAQMLEEVAKSWQRPGIYEETDSQGSAAAGSISPLSQKLESIQIPSVSFSAVDLTRVVSALSDLSAEFDTATSNAPKGLNIVVIDPQSGNPPVSITLRNLSLKRILDVITDSVGYQYEVQNDLVVVRPGGETSTLDTEFFPVSQASVIRMTGISGGGRASSAARNDPFAPTPAASSGGSGGGESGALRAFLQQAGINFDGVPGASLAFDGSMMIVTQTTRNIERIRNFLQRYSDVRQVEIEAKFMEVQQGALEELGVNWGISRRGVAQFDPATGAPILGPNGSQLFTPQETYSTTGVNRSLADAFSNSTGDRNLTIDTQNFVTGQQSSRAVPFNPPLIPGAVQLASGSSALGAITGMVGEFDVTAVIRALSQQSGSDLLSAPKITALSGETATITVAQELIYPELYGEIQSEVGTSGGATTGGSAGVTITAGAPQQFTMREVGVKLVVRPDVGEDQSITLKLDPEVTEFEGFVEYGGTSIAISGGNTVTVPSGFYQPIFSVRKLSTKVTVWDGATLVMGGLTREEVSKVDDKVPFLGDIPFLGRAFRSKGESTQKRNLLIFITANLVSPGGSPANQRLKSVAPNSLFQNPTIVTPASSEARVRGN
jgi:general secretion pathway protein D